MHFIQVVGLPAAGILIMEIIGFGLFRRRKLSKKQGSGGAAGFSSAMGVIIARDDQKLLSLFGFLSDAGFGRSLANLTTDMLYVLLAVAFSYLVWTALSKLYSRNVITLR